MLWYRRNGAAGKENWAAAKMGVATWREVYDLRGRRSAEGWV